MLDFARGVCSNGVTLVDGVGYRLRVVMSWRGSGMFGPFLTTDQRAESAEGSGREPASGSSATQVVPWDESANESTEDWTWGDAWEASSQRRDVLLKRTAKGFGLPELLGGPLCDQAQSVRFGVLGGVGGCRRSFGFEELARILWGEKFEPFWRCTRFYCSARVSTPFAFCSQAGEGHIFLPWESASSPNEAATVVHELAHIEHLIGAVWAGKSLAGISCWERESRAVAAEWWFVVHHACAACQRSWREEHFNRHLVHLAWWLRSASRETGPLREACRHLVYAAAAQRAFGLVRDDYPAG